LEEKYEKILTVILILFAGIQMISLLPSDGNKEMSLLPEGGIDGNKEACSAEKFQGNCFRGA